jgi:hypothetical protein
LETLQSDVDSYPLQVIALTMGWSCFRTLLSGGSPDCPSSRHEPYSPLTPGGLQRDSGNNMHWSARSDFCLFL